MQLAHALLAHAALWSWAIALSELAVGLGLIVGVLTGIAAFFGGLMNMNYLFAGTHGPVTPGRALDRGFRCS